MNPEFSHVEADVAQLNVNTQFALSYPERRPFFLESSDFFVTPFTTVYTRNVADPSWGVRLTGKEGRNAFAAFVAADNLTNILIPGSQSSQIVQTPGSSTNSVFRYRRDVGKTSTIGALFTSRTGSGYGNGVAGLDASLRLTPATSVTVHLLGSRTDYPDAFTSYRQSTDTFKGTAKLFNLNHSKRNWRAYAGYHDVDRGFRADLGNIPRVDYRTWRAGAERIWWNDRKNRRFPRISGGVDWDDSQDQSGAKLFDSLQVEDQPLLTANLSQLRSVYHFNAQTFVRAVLQYTDIERNTALYRGRVARHSGHLLSQMLFSYKLNPRTVVLLGYSDGRLADDSVDLTLTDRTWFLKLGYAWTL